jgi:hypothetical protein
MSAACAALRARAGILLLNDWTATAPPPSYYPYPLQLTPHPFMGLGKFIAGRLHQMRSQKSYLAGHHDWAHDSLPHCPRCGGEPESLDHAILTCPSTAYPRARLLQAVTDIGPESPLWSDLGLLLSLSDFIKATKLGFPPSMRVGPPSSSLSSCPSRQGSPSLPSSPAV